MERRRFVWKCRDGGSYGGVGVVQSVRHVGDPLGLQLVIVVLHQRRRRVLRSAVEILLRLETRSRIRTHDGSIDEVRSMSFQKKRPPIV